MGNEFNLPGAENFARYLGNHLEGELVAKGPEKTTGVAEHAFSLRWIVMLDGEKIGEYVAQTADTTRAKFSRYFKGRIPGYINESLLRVNEIFTKGKPRPVDAVTLAFTNATRYVITVEPPWERKDGHKDIPFP